MNQRSEYAEEESSKYQVQHKGKDLWLIPGRISSTERGILLELGSKKA